MLLVWGFAHGVDVVDAFLVGFVKVMADAEAAGFEVIFDVVDLLGAGGHANARLLVEIHRGFKAEAVDAGLYQFEKIELVDVGAGLLVGALGEHGGFLANGMDDLLAGVLVHGVGLPAVKGCCSPKRLRVALL